MTNYENDKNASAVCRLSVQTLHLFLTTTWLNDVSTFLKVCLPTTCACLIESSNRVSKELLNDVFVSTFVAFRKQQQTQHNVYKIWVRKKCGLNKIKTMNIVVELFVKIVS